MPGHLAKQRSVFAHLKQVQAALGGRALNLEHQLAAEADFLLDDFDGVPGQATLLPLGNGGLGTLDFKLFEVLLLLELHEGLHLAQLFFQRVRIGKRRLFRQKGRR